VKHLLITLILLTGISASAQPIGKILPEFQFQTLDGTWTSLSEMRKETPRGVVMLTFWCTTCNSCRANEQTLANLAKEFSDQAKVVAVASSRNDSVEDIQHYLKRHELDLPVILDPGSEFGRYLKVQRTTTTALLDRSGRLRYYGTLRKQSRFHAKIHLESVLANRIVSQPIGPIYG
jgi:peroxiredoxin